MDSATLGLGSFCSGVGLLDLAAKLALEYHGHRAQPVFVCEWDAYAAAVLRSRMAEEALESCPIWCGDLRSFPSPAFRGMVDVAVAGFPCTDISRAGAGAGIGGEQSRLFFDILEAACDLGARYLFLENSAEVPLRGLDAVLGSLAEVGFDAEWTCLQAAEVGASHRRERWFCVAWKLGDSLESGLPLAERGELPGAAQQHQGRAAAQSGRPLFAPGPQSPAWGTIIQDNQNDAPATQPGILRVADGEPLVLDANRVDRIRCLGNSVVVLQAATAFAHLIERMKHA